MGPVEESFLGQYIDLSGWRTVPLALSFNLEGWGTLLYWTSVR